MELVSYLKDNEIDFAKRRSRKAGKDADIQAQFRNEQWDKIVKFMRNNPKLLMQMIPDDPTNPIIIPKEYPSEAAIKRSRVHEKLLEAQRWQKL